MKKPQYFNGRSDGIGNRIEEVIGLESICSKFGLEIVYIWNNEHSHRHYPVLFEGHHVRIVDQAENVDFFQPTKEHREGITQAEILAAAKGIRPKFSIGFKDGVVPVGVHIRGTDRIGQDHPHFMKDNNQFIEIISKTVRSLNNIKPRDIFVCSDSSAYKEIFLDFLDKSINVVEPVHDNGVSRDYADFFALTLCEKIYLCSKFSSFSICASLIGNIPLVAYEKNEVTENRYKALFNYDLESLDDKDVLDIHVNDKAYGTFRQKLESMRRCVLFWLGSK